MNDDLSKILDLARWAPSGDNSQQWRINILSEKSFSIALSGFKKNIYNLCDTPDLLSIGTFIECARVAASSLGYNLSYEVKSQEVLVFLEGKESEAKPHLLEEAIKTRSVNRFPYKFKKVDIQTKRELEDLIDEDFEIIWLEEFTDRWPLIRICMLSTDIRLRLKETYQVHKEAISWEKGSSKTKMPLGALGVNPLTQVLMKVAMKSFSRNQAILKIPAATLPFQIEMDLLPGILSAGHFLLAYKKRPPKVPEQSEIIRAGQNMMRLWLGMEMYGIVLQPLCVPIIFSFYISEGINFTQNAPCSNKAKRMSDKYKKFLSNRSIRKEPNDVCFLGRYGYPTKKPSSRSLRKELAELIQT